MNGEKLTLPTMDGYNEPTPLEEECLLPFDEMRRRAQKEAKKKGIEKKANEDKEGPDDTAD